MRTFAALLVVATTAGLTVPALAQTNDPANPTAPGPVPPPLDAAWPPVNVGCGENGTTKSDIQPTVRLTSATLRLTRRGGVGIRLRGNQTAAMFVKIAQVGGKRVGGTAAGSYTCTTPRNSVIAPSLNAYGRKLVRRRGRLRVRITFRLINGTGVTNTRVLSGVIRPV